MNNLFNKKRILVIAAHPDDEILGLGGTIHRLTTREGCSARVVILGEGITSRSEVRDTDLWKKELEQHRKNIHTATKLVNYESVGIYDFPDNRFDSVALLDIVKKVELEISQFKPDIIFTQHANDLNIDHQITFQAVITATRPLPGKMPLTIITFETPSSTEWQVQDSSRTFFPNIYLPIKKEDLVAKQNALKAYSSECQPFPHPRSVQGLEVLAQYRGMIIGQELAEAFNIVRSVGSIG